MNTKHFTSKKFVKNILPKRQLNTHKGSYGAILNIAGSENYRGAAYLSSVAALKVGAGYVTTACSKSVASSISAITPDIVLLPLVESNGTIQKNEYKKIIDILPKYNVLSLGCGISSLLNQQEDIEEFIKNLLKEIKYITIPVVIDADGLNIIAKTGINELPENTILTPHPKELSRLLNISSEEIQKDRIKYAQIAEQKYKSIVVLKGYQTIITNGKEFFINPTGNSALAKAGSGDVLTGIISGFLAQGLSPFNAAVCGVYLHGLTGEIASEQLTEYSVNASDLLEFIQNTIKKILK